MREQMTIEVYTFWIYQNSGSVEWHFVGFYGPNDRTVALWRVRVPDLKSCF